MQFKNENEDDVWQILDYVMYKPLCKDMSDARICAAMQHQFDASDTVIMIFGIFT